MKKDKIETIIEELRIRPQSNPQDRLETILCAHDQCQQSQSAARHTKRVKIAWSTALAAAAIILLVISLRVPPEAPQHDPKDEGRTMAVPQYQINTAGSLQKTFCQEGLEGLERQLDQACKLYGPGPAVPLKIDLL